MIGIIFVRLDPFEQIIGKIKENAYSVRTGFDRNRHSSVFVITIMVFNFV